MFKFSFIALLLAIFGVLVFNFVLPVFADSNSHVFAITIDHPSGNDFVFNPVRVNGTWNVTNPPGQLRAYDVQIQWGDNITDAAVNISRTELGGESNQTFVGNYDTDPQFNHNYVGCGYFNITVKLYHSQPPGSESGDATAQITIFHPCEPQIVCDHCYYNTSFNIYPGQCSCTYSNIQYCPTPGNVTDGVCYYGNSTMSYCSNNGCQLSTASMGSSNYCDPQLGPIKICSSDSQCDDGNPCTNDACSFNTEVNNTQCVHTANDYQEQQSCGSENCAGTQTRTCSDGQFGQWSDCSSSGQDCGVCGSCDTSGTCSYDSSQNSDCSQNDLPLLGTCSYDPDSISSTWDYAFGVQSVCTGLNQCSQPQYEQIFHTCNQTLAGSCQGWQCDENTVCQDYCSGNTRFYNGACDSSTCTCSYLTEDCNLQNGWYNTTTTQWVSDAQCTEKEQLQQEYRDFTCAQTPSVGCTYTVTEYQWTDTGGVRNKQDNTTCDDGLFCSVNDVCTAGVCGGTTRDCSANDISGIANCPDDFTWNFRNPFPSQCFEDGNNTGHCTTGDDTIVYDSCPLPGTVNDTICYYGNRTCDANGCGLLNSTLISSNMVCDPQQGPMPNLNDTQPCNYSEECISGNCAPDFSGSGNWCAPSGNCTHEGTSYDNGTTVCYDSTRETCDNGNWSAVEVCQYGCSDGSCNPAPSTPSNGGGSSGGGSFGGGFIATTTKTSTTTTTLPASNTTSSSTTTTTTTVPQATTTTTLPAPFSITGLMALISGNVVYMLLLALGVIGFLLAAFRYKLIPLVKRKWFQEQSTS